MLRNLTIASALLIAAPAFTEERVLTAKELPPAISSAIAKQFPNSRILKAIEQLGGGGKHFEVTIQDGID